MNFVVALLFLSITGFPLMCFGGVLLWTDRGGRGAMIIRIRGHEISIRGPIGILCIVLGIPLILLAVNLMLSSGSNTEDQRSLVNTVSGGLPFVAPLMAAQSSQAAERSPEALTQEADTREETGETRLKIQESDTVPTCTGWVYVGPAGKKSGWAFSVDDSSRSSNAQLEHHWIRAKQSMVVREDPYDDFTGTWIGKLIGADEPDVIGVIEADALTYVHDEVRVGRGVIWVKIPCPETQSPEQK